VKGFTIAAALFLLSIGAFCQETATLLPSSYAYRSIGARAAGLSGMQVACADDPSALYTNPACLGYLVAPNSLFGSITPLSFGRSLSNLAATLAVGTNAHVGFGLVAMNTGTITRRDAAGTLQGTSTLWQGTAAVAASYMLTDQSSVGVAGRLHIASAPDPASSGTGIGVDIGYVTSVLGMATLGASLQNLGTMTIGSERFALPWMLRVGVCTVIPFEEQVATTTSATLGTSDTIVIPSSECVLFGIEAQYRAQSPTPTLIVGTEIIPHSLVAIRGGIAIYGESLGVPQLIPGTFFSGGVSLHLPSALRLDYAIARGVTTALVHTLSIVARLD